MSFPIGPLTRTPADAKIVANLLAESIDGVQEILADADLPADERADGERLLAGLRDSHDVYFSLSLGIDWIG